MNNASDFIIEKGYCGNPDVVVLKKYNGTDTEVTVPDGVTMIDFMAFSRVEVTCIHAPDSLTSVDLRSFSNGGEALADENGFCVVGKTLINYVGKNETVEIPEGVRFIDYVALANRNSIRKVIMPTTIEVVGNQAFGSCSALEEVVFPEHCPNFREVAYSAFGNCAQLRSINLPASVQIVADGAFFGCEKLRDSHGNVIIGNVLISCNSTEEVLHIPDGITMIAEKALAGCKPLEIILPDSLRRIGGNMCWMMKNLTKVTIPDTVEYIDGSAFAWCEKLESVSLKGVRSIGKSAFEHCTSLHEVRFGADLEKVGDGAFSNCQKLTSIQLPAGLKRLGDTTEYKRETMSSGAFSYTGIKTVTLPEGLELLGRDSFAGCGKLQKVTIPGSIKVIGSRAFSACDALATVNISDGVETIEREAFAGCGITDISFAESIFEIKENAFVNCPHMTSAMLPAQLLAAGGAEFAAKLGIGDENGCIINNGTLVAYVGAPGVVRITDGVECISANVFNRLFHWTAKQKTTRIILPDSVSFIDENNLGYDVEITMPNGYLHRRTKQNAKFLHKLMSRYWQKQLTMLDYACGLLFQSGKDMISLCKDNLGRQPQESAEAFLAATKLELKGAEYAKAAEFIFENRKKIRQETVDAFYAIAKASKATKAVDTLKAIVSQADTAKPVAPLSPIEEFCTKLFSLPLLDKTVKKAKLTDKVFEGVLYKESKIAAPAFVIKCAIVPYIELMEERPKRIGDYKTDWLSVKILEQCDRVAKELDPQTFIAALEKIANLRYGTDKPQCLIPLCRYGDGEHIKSIISAMSKWDDWYTYSSSGRSAIIVARGAIFLNESREAMLYAEKCKLLRAYAAMRGLDEDVLRDTKLSEFGLDENGKKLFNLGNTVIEASVGQDLSISLYDTTANKVVKSLPKKGADLDKHATATAELSDLKKNLKKVVKTRNDILFERFLDGKSQKAPAWIASYTKNPTLHRIAELMVWSQKGKTFILTATGAIDHNGDVYQVNDTDAICVAHPKDMKAEELAAWQNYFTSHGLKQPFEQIWEPVVDSATVTEDRYKDCMIPFYRFKGREKHGIYIQDWDFHNQIDISFDGCNATVERIDWARHEIDMNHRFAVQSISFRALTRKVNHILAYLDRITVYDRIVKDDVSVAQFLPRFTLAQIAEFIKVASENNCTNVTAILLEYRQKNFSDYDPMVEFTLE